MAGVTRAGKRRMDLGSLDLSTVSSPNSSAASTPVPTVAPSGQQPGLQALSSAPKLMLPSILGGSDEMDSSAIQVISIASVTSTAPATAAPAKSGIAARRGKALNLGVASAANIESAPSSSSSFNIEEFQGTIRTLDEARINNMANLRLEDLETLHALGEGAQGAVDKVVHRPSGTLLARKRIRLDTSSSSEADKKREELYTEVKTYAQSSCPFVVRSFACFLIEDIITIVLEFMDCGSLESVIKRIGPLPEWIIREVALQICLALKYLHHDRRLVHRDLKPANILMSADGMVKLTDFGVSKEITASLANAHTFVGTFTYMSPERIDSSRSTDGGYSFSSDVWSFGLILAECAVGSYPYPKEVVAMPFAYMQAVCEPAPIDSWLPPSAWSPEFRSFVGVCMHTDPLRRESAAELLSHPFIRARTSTTHDFASWLGERR
eukprot:c52120_g1_i1.p1 GENE.c52120_g1_i1~~c52120_g1_i1.p1  ORF type:complete len:438 (+),score=63.13 c52120_g1_i1:26-1339(+)